MRWTLRASVASLVVAAALASERSACSPWCVATPCDSLNGDVARECGACTAEAACAPGKLGYPSPPQPCAELTGPGLLRLTAEARAAALSRPALVSNVTDSWPDHRPWLRHFRFDNAHPDETAREAPRLEARRAITQIFDAYYGEPELFERTTRLRVSYNEGAQGGHVSFCHHGFSWLALLEGTKTWYFAPPDRPLRAESPSCEPGQAAPAGVSHTCVQRAGQLIVVPAGYWHSTCSGAGVAFAFGGEDDCDVTTCRSSAASAGRPPRVCRDLGRAVECHGATGAAEARDAVEDPPPEEDHPAPLRLPSDSRRGKRLEQSMMILHSVDARAWEAAAATGRGIAREEL